MDFEKIKELKNQISNKATIVAASKYVGCQEIRDIFQLGINHMGENRVQAFLEKYDQLTDLDIKWHFIGHLQTNKIKDVINKIDYLHSLDSIKLAKKINENATKKIKCFIEINNGEDTKTGLHISDLPDFVKELEKCDKIEIVGLMTMAPLTSDDEAIRYVFSRLKELQGMLAEKIPTCQELSMGMSNDYQIALECGATFLRLGRILWGE